MRDAQIVSSNDSTVDTTLARLLADSGIDWKDEGITRIEYRGTTLYAVRAAYKDYRLFALYPKSEVMSDRISFVAVGVLVCLAFWVVVLLARNIVDHRILVE